MTVSSNGTPTLKSTVFAAATATVTPTAWPTASAPLVNHLILAVVTVFGTTTGALGATPGGWTLSNSITGSARAVTAYYTKTATGSDSFPTFNGAETGTAIDAVITAVLYDLSDSGGSTPIVWTDGGVSALAGTMTASCGGMPAGCFVIAACVAAGASATTTWTVPGTFTLDVDQLAAGFAQTYCAHQTSAPAAAACSTHLFTHSRTSTFQSGMVIGIAPPGSTGVRQFIRMPLSPSPPGAAAYTSPSFTPKPNELLVALVLIGNSAGQTITSCTVTGSGGTWTKLKGSTFNSNGWAGVWAMDAGAAPSAQTITVTQGALTITDPNVHVIAFVNAANTAAQAVQAALNAQTATGTTTTVSVTPAETGSQVVASLGSYNGSAIAVAAATDQFSQVIGGSGDTEVVMEANTLTTATVAQAVGTASIGGTGLTAVEIIPAPPVVVVSVGFGQPRRARIASRGAGYSQYNTGYPGHIHVN